jgi:hypothetical protein
MKYNYVIVDYDKKFNIENVEDLMEFNIIFDFKKYINDVYKSYGFNFDNVLNQFVLDLPRSIIMFNGIHIKTLFNINIKKDINDTLFNIIIMLCCQSSMAYPMEKITEYYNLIENGYLLLDLQSSQYNNSMCVDILNLNTIVIDKKLRICKIINDDLIDYYHVNIHLKFKFNNIDNLFDINNIEIESENILYWSIEKLII